MKVSMHSLLQPGKTALGGFIQLGSEALMEMMAYAGYQFFILDNEHAWPDAEINYRLIRTCEALDVPALVRVSDINESEIKRALDAGASGLMVPNVHTLEDAQRVIQYTKFAPIGARGACPFVRANRYNINTGGTAAYCANANEDTYIILSVEGPGAVDEMEQLLTLPGVDAISVGSFDLSVALGIPGQIKHPRIAQAQQKMVDLARKHGKDLFGFTVDLDSARFWMSRKPEALIHRGDSDLLAEKICEEMSALRGILPAPPAQ